MKKLIDKDDLDAKWLIMSLISLKGLNSQLSAI